MADQDGYWTPLAGHAIRHAIGILTWTADVIGQPVNVEEPQIVEGHGDAGDEDEDVAPPPVPGGMIVIWEDPEDDVMAEDEVLAIEPVAEAAVQPVGQDEPPAWLLTGLAEVARSWSLLSILSALVIFALGLAIGGGCTYFCGSSTTTTSSGSLYTPYTSYLQKLQDNVVEQLAQERRTQGKDPSVTTMRMILAVVVSYDDGSTVEVHATGETPTGQWPVTSFLRALPAQIGRCFRSLNHTMNTGQEANDGTKRERGSSSSSSSSSNSNSNSNNGDDRWFTISDRWRDILLGGDVWRTAHSPPSRV